MAHINGITPGLRPEESAAYVAAKTTPKEKKIVAPNEVICEICKGHVGFDTARKKHASPCRPCRTFFGLEAFPGQTDVDPEDALEKMAKLREAGWALILRRMSFGTKSGESYVIEPGDIFKVEQAGDADRLAKYEHASQERTGALFSAAVMVGQERLKLFPHELSSISFVTVMQMKAAGELTECFISAGDAHGHFAPTPEIRAQIYNAFGGLTGCPRN